MIETRRRRKKKMKKNRGKRKKKKKTRDELYSAKPEGRGRRKE